jgi:dTDP-4-dehydrorhamnose reductase
MPSPAEFLIIGGDSQIGSAVRLRLLSEGKSVSATSRRPGSADIRFDLSEPPSSWSGLPRADIALIAAGIADQARCAGADARRVNVDHTIALTRSLVEGGTRVVFLSTNLVLDGETSFAPASSDYRPQSAYGLHKAEAEQALLAMGTHSGGSVAVIRLSKVVYGGLPLLQNWMADLEADKAIVALSDLMIAPVTMNYTVDVIARVMRASEAGLYQMSGATEVSYADVAQALAKALGKSYALVSAKTSGDVGIRLPAAPRHPGLDASRVFREFGIAPQLLDEVIDELIANR